MTDVEWCKMWEEYSRNPNTVLEWQTEFRDFMFDLEDTSGIQDYNIQRKP